MGRRSLPKVSPETDVSEHLIHLDQLAEGADLCELVSTHESIEVEVGSGKGLFLHSASQANPSTAYLGIELARKYARFAAARLAKAGRKNAYMIQGDAEVAFANHLRESSLGGVHIYFPDPWWKKRHHKRRIMNAPFLNQVVRVLRPGGQLHFWTDVQEYFELSLDLIAREVPLEGPVTVPEATAEHDLDYRTHFERRTRLEGRPVYRALFHKTA